MKSSLGGLEKNVSMTVITVVLLAVAGRDFEVGRLFGSPQIVLFWLGLLAAGAFAFIPRARGRSPIAIRPGLDFAFLLMFGTGPACWFALAGSVVAASPSQWRPLYPFLWSACRAVATVAVTGWFLSAAGIVAGSQAPPAIALIGAAVLYLGLHSGLAAAETVLGGQRQDWSSRIKEEISVQSVTVLSGILLGLVWFRLGIEGAALFAVPLGLLWYVDRIWSRQRKAEAATVRTLMAAVDASDPLTRGHSYRISRMCVRIARHMGLPETEIRSVEYAALLHDLGRTATQHDLVNKSGKLTREEQSMLQAHPEIGYEMARQFEHDRVAEEIILSHHERPDGKGYPRGLDRDRIPVGSRIIMVVAAFDAMTSDRPYRRGLAPEVAFEELLSHSGTQFFPDIVEALIDLYSKGRLFEDFEKDEFKDYWEGRSNSRAVEEFLRECGDNEVPEKMGVDTTGDNDLPVIEFAESPPRENPLESRFRLDPAKNVELWVAAATDVGCVRTNNEDSFAFFEMKPGEGVVLALADGMGGAAAGEVASRIAVDTLEREISGQEDKGDLAEALERSIQMANLEVYSKAYTNPELHGMGTTITAMVLKGSRAVVGHVGDSRAYLVSRGSIRVLTRDHTLAAELEEMSGPPPIVPGGAENVLTRCLGNKRDVSVEMSETPIELEPESILILCSDGLSSMVTPEEILEITTGHAPLDACKKLVELARERGGPDNITVEVAKLAA